MDNSTICAVSTAVGTGAISIVRLTGDDVKVELFAAILPYFFI